jgi:glycosyltransferase involved in cell wall biosynthesis
LVTVVVPSYNQEKIIYKTLMALADQDYPNYEIYVIDDSSTDSTADIAHDFFINCKCRGKLIVFSQNKGSARSRNKGITDANGEYIIFVDGDDLPEKDYIYSLVKTISNKENNFDAAFCGFTEVNSKNGDKKIQLPGKDKLADKKPFEIAIMRTLNKIPLSFWAAIYKKDFLIKNKILFNELSSATCDVNFVIKSLLFADSVSFIDKSLYNYIIHPAMLSKKRLDPENKIKRYRGLVADIEDLFISFSQFAEIEKIKSFVEECLEPQWHIKNLSYLAMINDKIAFHKKLKDPKTEKSLRRKMFNFNYNIEITGKSILLVLMPSIFYSYYKNRL